MKTPFLILSMTIGCAAALPAHALTPVAEGFPDWKGVGTKPPAYGRELSPSDLRHKATVIVEFEGNAKLADQLAPLAGIIGKTGLVSMYGVSDWETRQLPRNLVVVLSNRSGGKGRGAIDGIVTYQGEDEAKKIAAAKLAHLVKSMGCSVYDNVTFTGAPDSTGKRPFIYVMGPTGKTPLFKGELKADNMKAIGSAVAQAMQATAGWKPFYGTVSDSKYHPQIEKALKEGKPLGPIEKTILKDVTSKDPETAKTAQILYDALNQTRSDLALKIMFESLSEPHCAAYDIQRLTKYWPSEKKRIEEAANKIKEDQDLSTIAKTYCQLMEWADPNFTCKNASEANAIVMKLKMLKKKLEKMKKSTDTKVQTGLLLMEPKIDELISTMPNRLPAK